MPLIFIASVKINPLNAISSFNRLLITFFDSVVGLLAAASKTGILIWATIALWMPAPISFLNGNNSRLSSLSLEWFITGKV